MRKNIEKIEYKIYKLIKKGKENFATFQKCLFHLHTPASYDYKLFSAYTEDAYDKLTDSEIYKIALQEKLYIKVDELDAEEYKEIKFDENIFHSLKEYITYLLIAKKIIDNNIRTVLISDHNTIDGYNKLKEAIKIYTKDKVCEKKYNLLLGVEISCADQVHVVVIFENSENQEQIRNFLKEYIMGERQGTYLTSLSLMEEIDKIGGISYISHINSSDILKTGSLTETYKKKLFNTNILKMIGLKDVSNIEDVKQRLSKFAPGKEFSFIRDSDAHDIDTIKDTCFFVKSNKFGFSIIKDIIRDGELSARFDNKKENKTYLIGLAVKNLPENFIQSKNNEEYMVVKFSESLNCFVGGRGTGKSTFLNLIEFTLSQNVKNKNILEMICKHKEIWLLFKLNYIEYLCKLELPCKEYEDDDIMRYFDDRIIDKGKYTTKHCHFSNEIIRKHVLSKCTLLYEIRGTKIEKVKGAKTDIFKQIFKKAYSMNELVIKANSDGMSEYLRDIIMENNCGDNEIKISKKNTKVKVVEDFFVKLEEKKEKINSFVSKYNKINGKNIRIKYDCNTDIKFDFFNKGTEISNRFCNYNITYESSNLYFENVIKKCGIKKFVEILENREVSELEDIENITDYIEELSFRDIEKGIINIENLNKTAFLREIIEEVNNSFNLTLYLEKLNENYENFSLEFNINSNKIDSNPLFKNIQVLSLGQKVVAILSFILSYSEYSDDFTPLIIDQPEDNLDNQYIYNNLVKELRKVKDKRQIIISTHNSTIVTNAKAENVIVLNSDNFKCWIEKSGYALDINILKQILNYLEGGKLAFLHKQSIYNEVLKK